VSVILTLLKLAIVAWLPGAILFRLPIADRSKRAALDAEERLFWAITLSLIVSLSTVLALAAVGRYSFERLLLVDIGVAAAAALAAKFRLALGPTARRPGLTIAIPLALALLGWFRFFPSAEYVIGGKDPGVYVAEGIQIAQRGTLVYSDPVVAAVPAFARDLFYPSHQRHDYYGVRFMGFFVKDPDRGTVVGQFPHLFPASIAIGYGIDGLTGARRTVGFWAMLGVLAVYFAAVPLAGRPVAAAAATLLALHVIQVWFARYPNAEIVMQALLFAAMLGFARSHADGDRFFAAVTGVLLGLLLFLRIDAALGIIAALIAVSLLVASGRGWRPGLLIALAAVSGLAALYLLGPMRAYADRPILFLTLMRTWQQLALVLAAIGALTLLVVSSRLPLMRQWITTIAPITLAAAVLCETIYALYFRTPVHGVLADYDAYALRRFVDFYFTVPALFAAVAGFALLVRRRFWESPAIFVTVAVFAFFVFYKTRIVPEHFWAARRYLPVILPGALVFACAAAGWGFRHYSPGRSNDPHAPGAKRGLAGAGIRRIASGAIGAVFVVLLGLHYARAARPIVGHVEYAGIIPALEQLAGRIGDDELLIVESRDSGSDAHVMALPLAYIYARPVLVLASARPERQPFSLFLDWARTRYGRVYFLGGGGTELLSRQWSAASVASQRFQVPEYESALNRYPRYSRQKEFDFGLYELLPAGDAPESTFDLDIGINDDLNVVRFHAKEVSGGRTVRWTQRQSFVTIPQMFPTNRVAILVMNLGGRPQSETQGQVTAYLNETLIGTAWVTNGFNPYSFSIPAAVAEALSKSDEPARLRLVTPTWNPHRVLGSPDDRDLGVMVDRVTIK
jgi:hypothetical protein